MVLNVGDKVILLNGQDGKQIAYPVTTNIAVGNKVILGETHDKKLVALNVCNPEVNKNGFNVLTHDKKLAIVQTCSGCYWIIYMDSGCGDIVRNVCYLKEKNGSGNTIKSTNIIRDNTSNIQDSCADATQQFFQCSDDPSKYLIESGVCNNGCGTYRTFCHGKPKSGINFNNTSNWIPPTNYALTYGNNIFYSGEIGGRFINPTTPIGPYCGDGPGFNGIYTPARYVTTNNDNYITKHVFHKNQLYFFWNITFDIDIFNNEVYAINVNNQIFNSSANINTFSSTPSATLISGTATKGCLWVYNNIIYAGNNNGIWSSSNGSSWTQLSTLSCNCIQDYNNEIYFGVDSIDTIGLYKLSGSTLQQITTEEGLYGNNCTRMTTYNNELIIVIGNFVYSYDGTTLKTFCYSKQLSARVDAFGPAMGTILDVVENNESLNVLFYDVLTINDAYFTCELILNEEYVLGLNS